MLKIVRQGKYECAPASFSQLTGIDLFTVKRLLGRFGWRNDSSGCNDKELRQVAHLYGKDLVYLGPKTVRYILNNYTLPNSLLTIPSLNYKGRYHSVSYVDGLIIDPNFERLDREYLSLDTTLHDLDIRGACILVDRVLDANEWKVLKFIAHGTIRQYVDALIGMGVLKG